MICKNPPKRSDGKSSFADLMKYINVYVSERQNKNEKTLFTATLNMDSGGENFRHRVYADKVVCKKVYDLVFPKNLLIRLAVKEVLLSRNGVL